MTDTITMDQKIELLKIAGKDSPLNLKESYRGLLSLLSEDRCRKCRDSLKNVINKTLESSINQRIRPSLRLTEFLDECYSRLKDEDGQSVTLILTRYKHGYYTFKHHDRCFSCRDDELEGVCGNRMRLQRNDGTIKNQKGDSIIDLHQLT